MGSLRIIAFAIGAVSFWLAPVGCGSTAPRADGAGQAGSQAGGASGTGGVGAGGANGGAGGSSVDLCSVPTGCCVTDQGCASTEECVGVTLCSTGQMTAGVCKPRPTTVGSCWSNDDCPLRSCAGAQVCPCGASCFAADQLGTCGL